MLFSGDISFLQKKKTLLKFFLDNVPREAPLLESGTKIIKKIYIIII